MSTKAAESAVLVNFATDMLLKFGGVNTFGSDMLGAGQALQAFIKEMKSHKAVVSEHSVETMLGYLEMFAKLGQSVGIKFVPKNHVLGHFAHRSCVI
eukprot:8418809-Pyramimonas_sp.AAC.1